LLSLAEHVFAADFGIDRLLLMAPRLQTSHLRTLMSPVAAGAFSLFALALLTIDWRTRREDWPAQFLCLGAMMCAVFGLLGLVWGPKASPITLAFPAVVNFFFLATGLLSSRATWAMGGLLVSRSRGASLLRGAIPAALLVLSLFDYSISKALLMDAHFTWVEVCVLAVLCSTMLAGFITWMAFIVERSDAERKAGEAPQTGQEQPDLLFDRLDEPQSEAQLRRKARMAFTVSVFLTGLLGFLSWYSAQQAAEDADWVAHTQEVSTTLEAALRHLVDVETGGRGFAETGSEPFLEPLESGRQALAQDLRALRLLIVDHGQARRLNVLEEQANTLAATMQQIVDARQNTGRVPSVALFKRGKQAMDMVRITVAEMQAAQRALLEQRVERALTARRFTGSIIALGAILCVAFLAVAGYSVSREISVSARAQAQVKLLNTALELRVEQRTAALEAEAAGRIKTEVKLRASEEMFRMLLDGIKDYAVYMLDPEGCVASWNSGAARMKGYPAEEIIGQNFSCFYIENDRDRNLPRESLWEALCTGRFEGEGWRVRKDGSRFWADAVITPLYEAKGGLRGYSKVVRDITERKRLDDELHKQAALLDLAHDAIIVRDPESRVVFWNGGAQQLYGWSAEEASGRVTHDLLQTKFPIPLAEIEAALASNNDWDGELRHKTRHDTEVVVTSRWSLQRDEFGEPTAILEINRDITDRKQAEAALGESEGRLAGVIASAMDAIITVDERHSIVLFNCAAEKMFRCPGIEAIGQPLTRFIPERYHAGHAGHIDRFGTTGVTSRAMGPREMGTRNILWGQRADGQEFQIEASISQVVTGGKKLFTVIMRDVTERIQAEKAVGEAQARMAGIVASAMDAIVTLDSRHRIVVFNAAAVRIFGYEEAAALGQPLELLIPRRFHAAHSDHVREFGKTGTTNRAMGQLGALWAVRANGEEFQIEASISQVEIGGEKMFTVILRDVTERKQAEEIRERLAAVVDSSDDAIIGKTLNGTITAWNRGAEKVFGYSSMEAVGQPIAMLMPPERVDEEDGILARIECGESVKHYETIRVRKDGTRIDVSATISPIRDRNGVVMGASKIARDITERKRAEAALAEQAEELSRQAEELLRSQTALETQKLMLQSILDSMSEGLVAADEQGKFIIWNPAAERIVGLGPATVSAEEWSAHYGLYLPDTVTPFPPEQIPMRRALHGEACTEDMYLRNLGLLTGVWIECSASPLIDKGGVLRGGVAAFRDVTQRRTDELEIRKLNDELEIRVAKRTAELEAANHELEAFTYSVSHDLRAPLRHIAGFAAMFLEEFGSTLDPEARHYLNRIQNGARSMGQMVDGLLNLSRMDRQSLHARLTGLNSVVEEVVSMLQAQDGGREVEWKVGSLPCVECDPLLMKQVFQNLISNAIKYSRPRARAIVEIGQTQENGEPVIFVRDNGVGFDMKYADKLFGVFQRLHRLEDFEGTGVGLATVHRIVQKHGGRVWAEAQVDGGATFYFTVGQVSGVGDTPANL
jgi:PAS domain S-box-containing protein